jgi:predicted ester cyclase
MIITGDRTASKWTFRGTHSGTHTALPISPSNAKVEMKGSSFAHLEGGKVIEEWIYGNYMGLFQQIGVIPSLEAEAP